MTAIVAAAFLTLPSTTNILTLILNILTRACSHRQNLFKIYATWPKFKKQPLCYFVKTRWQYWDLILVCFRSWSASARSRAGCFRWRSRLTGRTSTKSPPPPSALARTTIGALNITLTSGSCPAESTPRMRFGRTADIACDDRPLYESQQLVLWSGAP